MVSLISQRQRQQSNLPLARLASELPQRWTTMNSDIYSRIINCAKVANTSIGDVLLKAQEELGEIAAEQLKIEGIKPCLIGEKPVENRLEESCDLLLVALDLALRQAPKELIEEILTSKLEKWEKYVLGNYTR